MKIIALLILTISMVCLFSSCSLTKDHDNTINMPNFKIEDGKKGNEVVFDDSKIEEKNRQLSTFGEQPKDQNYTDKDGSSVRVSYDGYGNKTITRYFFNHPNLKLMIITETTDGTKEAIVYGHNNEHKKLEVDDVNKIVTASSNEIASKVGINAIKRENSTPTIVNNTQSLPKIPDPRFDPNKLPEQPSTETRESKSEVENEQPPIDHKQTVAKEKKNNEIEN